jgi:hypothetical protein
MFGVPIGTGMKNKYGFDEAAWEVAKSEGREILVIYAKRRQMIPYSEFITHVRSISFEGPHDPRLPHFLGEISEAESRAGRGMLTALVVHKHGDYQPGPGFFELARKLGHDTSDIEKFWIQEVKRVFDAWVE